MNNNTALPTFAYLKSTLEDGVLQRQERLEIQPRSKERKEDKQQQQINAASSTIVYHCVLRQSNKSKWQDYVVKDKRKKQHTG